MSELKHTPGPLVIKGDEIGYISKSDDQSFGMFCPIARVYDDEIASRIVACIIACKGLDTDDLIQNGLVSAVGNELLRRDAINAELLEALKFMLKVTRAVTIGEYDEELMDIAQSQAKSAIAKATGEQQ